MQIQYELLRCPPLRLAGDAECGICYHASCISPELALQWFLELRERIPWRHLRRTMYDRRVDVPRLVANVPLQDPGRPACLDLACAAVQQLAPAPYTGVGLNLYRDGADSVAPHGDRDGDLVPGQPIAILSLGAPRTMLIRRRDGGASQRLPLMPGSLLVMSHASQSTHEHAIPKCRQAAGARISLAFRVRRG